MKQEQVELLVLAVAQVAVDLQEPVALQVHQAQQVPVVQQELLAHQDHQELAALLRFTKENQQILLIYQLYQHKMY